MSKLSTFFLAFVIFKLEMCLRVLSQCRLYSPYKHLYDFINPYEFVKDEYEINGS